MIYLIKIGWWCFIVRRIELIRSCAVWSPGSQICQFLALLVRSLCVELAYPRKTAACSTMCAQKSSLCCLLCWPKRRIARQVYCSTSRHRCHRIQCCLSAITIFELLFSRHGFLTWSLCHLVTTPILLLEWSDDHLWTQEECLKLVSANFPMKL